MLSFELSIKDTNLLLVFVGQCFLETEFVSLLRKEYEKQLRPDGVIFLYPAYLKDKINEYARNEQLQTEITRYGSRVFVKFYSFDIQGVLGLDRELNKNHFSSIQEDIRGQIVRCGIESLVRGREADILAKSPSGTVFIKPSGNILEEFIYASQLSRDCFENQFLAFCLLTKAPDLKTVSWILVDTASISGVAEAVGYYAHKFIGGLCKGIKYKSFSSYFGMELQKPDDEESVWVIISASASTSLGRKIVTDWAVPAKNVVTILSYEKPLISTDVNYGNDVLFCIDKYSDRQSKTNSPVRVQVKGESFVAEISTPEKVLISKLHRPATISLAVEPFAGANVFSCNKSFVSGDPKPIYFNYSNYIEKCAVEDKFYDWLNKLITWTIPKNLCAIISRNVGDHALFLADVKNELRKCKFDVDSLKIIDPIVDDYDAYESLADGSVLVISPAISSGRSFLEINRSLRLVNHSGARIFATLFAMPATEKDYENFKRSVKLGLSNFSYQYVDLHHLCVGHKSDSSWMCELDVVRKISEDDSSGYWEKRKERLEMYGDGLNGLIGCNSKSADQILEFSKGFAFWNNQYDEKTVSRESIYITISAILEHLRENTINNQTLKSSVYKHCVLDPENFIRFNDPILQSCLWRAATAPELDYRRSDDYSHDMKNIIIKLIKAIRSDRGQAILDLCMAVAIRKIKLVDSHVKTIIAVAEEHFQQPHEMALLNYMKAEFK